ncbi:hypothetical protein FQN55_008432 [Onygenales sp. PD_40]|nr:hypothetical protein FQN55_008432 [Onygenales sp. PD_40]
MAAQGEEETPKYRPAKALPYELRQHCAAHLEEKLFQNAFDLLLGLLSAGTIASGPAFVPSPQLLAVAATVAVHPSTTTRTNAKESHKAANTALQLLRLTNKLVGPLGGRLEAAFTFTHFNLSRHGGRRRVNSDANGSSNGDYSSSTDTAPLNLDLARGGSLWLRAEDFWHAVGWAFNCSVLYPKRWARWQAWLQYMCEVLEDDWAERERLIKRSSNGAQSPIEHEILKESLIAKYILGTSGVSGHHRRILRAIFADGCPTALNEFRQVFHNELKEPGRDEAKLKRREVDVNVDEDIYGDYLARGDDDDSDELAIKEERPSRPKRSRTSAPSPTSNLSGDFDVDPSGKLPEISDSEHLSRLGGLPALGLRQRLLQLLSTVSASLPETFMTLDSLYHLFVEFIRHLPLPTFQVLVSSPVLGNFSDAARSSLSEMLLFRLLESAAPSSSESFLNQAKLENCFLPYAASTNSAVDNARVSLLLETLLRLLHSNGLLTVQPSLKQALEKGIMSRATKSQSDVRKGQGKLKAEESGWTWLIESGERMDHLVNKALAKDGHDKPILLGKIT